MWGANTPYSWYSHHPSLAAARYTIVEQSDASHPLSWFEANHPDWILYNCTSNGTPTRVPAYMQAGLYGTNAPIDMHNQSAVDFMIRNVAVPQAKAAGYNALALDQVVFSNIMGGNAGAHSYGCGVYQNGTFVRRYSGSGDYQFAVDMVNWVKSAQSIVTADHDNLKIVVNHPAGSISGSLEQELLRYADAALNENGFSYYGGYKSSGGGFATALNYMTYVQSLGHTAMLINKFVQSGPLSSAQREWVVAGYLIGNNGHALIYSTYGGYGTGGYGTEHYLPEYSTNMGMPCSAYGRDALNSNLYTRRFQNGMVVVNASTSSSGIARLPLNHLYHDIEGRAVTPALYVPPTDAFVMTTAAGTGCS
ncbi:MAG: hypothetical protein NVSMB64_18260 [Candidatus Velthaea sp.]